MKYTEILEQLINEINMSPNILRRLAANIDARAGMEFEMIVPEIGSLDDDDYFDSEPDYDEDEEIRDFSDIREFFYDGEHNSRRAVERLMEEIEGEYLDSDWLSEKKMEAWGDASYDSIKDLVDRDYADDLRDQAMDEVSAKTPEFGVNGEEFEQAVLERYEELVKEKIDEILSDMGSEYDEAFDDWQEGDWQDIAGDPDTQREWLQSEGHRSMRDISDNYDIEWPHWTQPENAFGDAEENAQRIADEFSEFMNKKVNFSMRYHGGRREPDAYVVEPDGSLEGDEAGDAGLEFVSPPMPISELLADLAAVKRFAENNGCYTNDSTGLHINVSVAGFSMEKLDYVKLAVLLGDERVLNEFGRMGNTYAKSALQIVKQNIKQRPDDAAALLNKMKEHLSTAAAKVIHSGTTNKYTSINTKTGYIEFRSPGGDWLGANYDLIEPTLLRFVVALDAALDETKYKQEYAKKLYKLLAPSSDEPGILELFANYSAGELDKEALIRQVRQKQLARDVGKGKVTGKMWWSVSRPGYMASIEVVAKSKEEAIDKAIEPGNYPDWASARNTLQATPLRPYQEKTKGPTLNNRPSNPDGNYVIVSQQDESVPVYRFMASGDQDAISVLRQWIAANPGLYRWTFKKDAEQALGQPSAAEQPAVGNQGNWGIWIGASNRFARQPNTIVDDNVLRRFPSQQAAEQFLAQTREQNPRMRTDVEVREIPSDYELPSTPVGTPIRATVGQPQPAGAPIPGSTLDLARQRAAAQQRFTGYWDVKMGDEVVFRVQAETQGEANQKARAWIQTTSPEFRQEYQGREVSVTPRYE